MPSKVWDEITYPLSNFNGYSVEVWEWVRNFYIHFNNEYDYFSMLRLKCIHDSKIDPSSPTLSQIHPYGLVGVRLTVDFAYGCLGAISI